MTASLLLLAGVNVLLMVAGQMLWKTGMEGRSVAGVMDVLQAMLSPLIIAGLALYGVATVLWLYILNKAQLSHVYPVQSLAYVLALVAACLLFKEHVTWNRWVGVAVICVGVYLVSIK